MNNKKIDLLTGGGVRVPADMCIAFGDFVSLRGVADGTKPVNIYYTY